MSHTSTYKQQISDVKRIVDVAKKLGYEVREGEGIVVHQFGRNKVDASVGIKLPGWKYEIALNKDGEILYDHWGSGADSFGLLGKLIQTYNQELITEAIPYSEINNLESITQENGDVKLILEYA